MKQASVCMHNEVGDQVNHVLGRTLRFTDPQALNDHKLICSGLLEEVVIN
jgi:hypothetical protein